MKVSIEHVAVYANDLEKTKDFYVKYFNGTSNEKYQNTKGFSSYFITFDGGARLEVMGHTDLAICKPEDMRTGYSHIAFSVGSKENVLKITEEITSAGYALLSPPRTTGNIKMHPIE